MHEGRTWVLEGHSAVSAKKAIHGSYREVDVAGSNKREEYPPPSRAIDWHSKESMIMILRSVR